MHSIRVMVRPVYQSTLTVPDIFAADIHFRTDFNPDDPWSDIDIVSDQECLIIGKFDNKTLMLFAGGVIGQQPGDCSFNRDDYAAVMICESRINF